MKPPSFIPQAACVPFRRKDDGVAEILLIRRVDSEDWGVPKGMIDEGNTARQTALIEAFEEAGLKGDLLDKDLGMFEYEKFGRTCRVRVYALHVREELDDWDEKGIRERCWFSTEKAAAKVSREALKGMIKTLVERLPWVPD